MDAFPVTQAEPDKSQKFSNLIINVTLSLVSVIRKQLKPRYYIS